MVVSQARLVGNVAADIRNFSLMFKAVALRMTKILRSLAVPCAIGLKLMDLPFFSTEISGKKCIDMYPGDMIYWWS